jgi:hypothetical protein
VREGDLILNPKSMLMSLSQQENLLVPLYCTRGRVEVARDAGFSQVD